MARPGGRGGAPGNSQRTNHPTWRFRDPLWTAAGTPRVGPLRSPSGGPSSRRLGEGCPGTPGPRSRRLGEGCPGSPGAEVPRPGTRNGMEEQAMSGADGGVVVTGVTGGLGGRVARRLAERGVRQRLGGRGPRRGPGLGGAEVVTGSYDDTEGLRRAFEGAGALFMVSASDDPDRRSLPANVVDAAVAAV